MAKKKSNTNSLIKTKGEWDKQDRRKKVATNGLIRTKAEWDELDKRWKEQQEEQKKQQREKKTNLLDSASTVNSARNKAEDYLKRQGQLKSAVKSTAAKDTREQKTYGRTTVASTTTKKQTVEPKSAKTTPAGRQDDDFSKWYKEQLAGRKAKEIDLGEMAGKNYSSKPFDFYKKRQENEEEERSRERQEKQAKAELERKEASSRVATQIREAMNQNKGTGSRQENTNVREMGSAITGGAAGRRTAGTTNLIDGILSRNRGTGHQQPENKTEDWRTTSSRSEAAGRRTADTEQDIRGILGKNEQGISYKQPEKEVTVERGYTGSEAGRRTANTAQDIRGILNRNDLGISYTPERSTLGNQGTVGSAAGRRTANTEQDIRGILNKNDLGISYTPERSTLGNQGTVGSAAGRKQINTQKIDQILGKNTLKKEEKRTDLRELGGAKTEAAGRRTGSGLNLDNILSRNNLNRTMETVKQPENTGFVVGGAGRKTGGVNMQKIDQLLGKRSGTGTTEQRDYLRPEYVSQAGSGAGRTNAGHTIDLSGMLNRNMNQGSSRDARYQTPETVTAKMGSAGRTGVAGTMDLSVILNRNVSNGSTGSRMEKDYTEPIGSGARTGGIGRTGSGSSMDIRGILGKNDLGIPYTEMPAEEKETPRRQQTEPEARAMSYTVNIPAVKGIQNPGREAREAFTDYLFADPKAAMAADINGKKRQAENAEIAKYNDYVKRANSADFRDIGGYWDIQAEGISNGYYDKDKYGNWNEDPWMLSRDGRKQRIKEIRDELGLIQDEITDYESQLTDDPEALEKIEREKFVYNNGVDYTDPVTGRPMIYTGDGKPEDYALNKSAYDAAIYDMVYGEGEYQRAKDSGSMPQSRKATEEAERLWKEYAAGTLGGGLDNARNQAESRAEYAGELQNTLKALEEADRYYDSLERSGAEAKQAAGTGYDTAYHPEKLTHGVDVYNTPSGDMAKPKSGSSEAEKAYFYINNSWQENFRQAYGYDSSYKVDKKYAPGGDDTIKDEYFLTTEEKEIFNSYFNRGDEKGAMSFLNGLKNALNYRRAQYETDIAREMSDPIRGAATVMLQPMEGLKGTLYSVLSLFDKNYADKNSRLYSGQRRIQGIRSGREEKWENFFKNTFGIQGVGKVANDITYSILDNVWSMGIGKTLTGFNETKKAMDTVESIVQFVMSTEATANTFYSQLQENRDTGRAAIAAFGDGFIEFITERIGLDALFNATPKELTGTGRQFVKYIAKNFMSEGGEEIIGEVMNTGLDYALSKMYGERDEIKRRADEIRSQNRGISEEDALKQAWGEKAGDIGLAFLSGGISGGIMSGTRGAVVRHSVNSFANKMTKQAIKNDTTGQILEAAKGIKGDSDYQKTIAALDETYQKNGKLNKKETFAMFRAIKLSGSKTAGGFADEEALYTVKSLVREKLNGKEVPAALVNEASEGVKRMLTGEDVTESQKEAMRALPESQDVMKDVMNEHMSLRMIANMAAKPGQKTEGTDRVGLELYHNGVASVADEQEEYNAEGERPKKKAVTTVIAGGKWGEIKSISVSEHQTVMVETEDGQKTDIRDVRATNQAMADVLHFVQRDSKEIDTKNGKTMTVFNHGSVEFVNKLLELAKTEKSSNLVNDALKVRLSTMLGLATPKTELSNAATVAIKAQAMKEFDASEAARLSDPHAVRPGEGEVYMNGVKYGTKEFTTMLKESGLSEEDQQYVKGIATVMRMAGVNTTIINDENQKYQGFENNTGIVINIGAKHTETAEDGTKVKTTYNPFITVGHELTHLLEHSSKEGYNALRKFVIEAAAEKGINVMNEINALILSTERNSGGKVQLDYAGAIAEYVANSADQILLDKDLIQRMQDRNPSLYKDMQGAVRKLIFRIKDAFKRLGGEGVQNDIWVNQKWSPEELKKIANLWGIAWEESADRTAGKGVGIESVIEADEARKAAEKTAKESQQFAEDNNFSYAGKQFKIGGPVEVRDDGMIAIHNMTMDRFKKSLAAGGMTWPSIAVASKDMKWENFGGDVSIYFGRDSVDPMKSENGMGTQRLYSGDAYTPMFRRDSGEYATMDAAEEFLKTQPERDYQTQDPTELLKDYRRVFDLEKARAQIQKQYGKDSDARVLTNKALKDKQYDALEAIRKDVKNHLLFSESTYNQMKTEDYVKRILFEIQDEIGVQRQQNPEAMTSKKIRQIISEKITDAAQTSRKDNGFVVKKGIKDILGEKAKNAAATIGKKTGFTVSQATADKIMDYITYAEEETGNEWLEAKLYRQAMYTEAAAIVLDKSETEAIAKLKDLGVDASRILTYDKNAPEGAADSKTEVRRNIPYLVEGTSFSFNGAAESRANDRVYAENDIRYKLADPEVRSYLQTWANNHVRKNEEEREAILGRYGLEPEDMAEGVLKESAMTGYGISKKDMNRLRVLARDTDKWQNRAVEAMGLDEEDLGAQYVTAWKNFDRAKMESILMEKLSERTDVIPFKAAQWYDRGRSGRGTHQQIANLIKENNPEAITIAAVEMANLVPENAVLIPMPPHTGKVTDETDTMVLARKIAELTGRPVMNALEGAERESRRENKDKTLKNQMTAEDLGFRKIMEIPEGTIPYFIDNLVAAGTTAKAARDAFGGGITLAYAKSTRTAIPGLKNAGVTFTDGKQMNLIPLEDRFDMDQTGVTGTRYSYQNMAVKTWDNQVKRVENKEAAPDDIMVIAQGNEMERYGMSGLVLVPQSVYHKARREKREGVNVSAHGISVETMKKVGEAIKNPVAKIDSPRGITIITDVKDSEGRYIIAPFKKYTDGVYGWMASSIHGRESIPLLYGRIDNGEFKAKDNTKVTIYSKNAYDILLASTVNTGTPVQIMSVLEKISQTDIKGNTQNSEESFSFNSGIRDNRDEGRTISGSLKQTNDGTIETNDGDPVAKELAGGSVTAYSYNTLHETVNEDLIKGLVAKGFKKKDVDKFVSDVYGVAAMIAADRDRLDYKSYGGTMLKNNQEYVKTLDASTLCAKRLLYQGIFDEISHMLPNTPLLPDDLIKLVNMMKKRGLVTPCGVCYVESRRRMLGKYAQEWLNRYNGENKPTLDQVTTSDGLENLRKTNNDAYESFMAAMKEKGSANPKVVELRTEYKGEIQKMTDSTVKKINDNGGLRIQSFSDFEVVHMLDMMQAVMDMASKDLQSQAYTKVPAFAWVFGDTGIKINLSLIGKGTGVDENGNLVFDDVEGMPFDEAMKIRNAYSKNVGTILVGMNDDHVIAAMGDDRIDFIIPFHKSGWSKREMALVNGMSAYKDFTRWQNEKKIDYVTSSGTVKTIPNKKSKITNFAPLSYWNFRKTGEQNAEIYLKKCAKDGRVPKFSNFLVHNGDGTYSLPQDDSQRSKNIRKGYWKLLIDFKMYDNEGKGSRQESVKPTFNMDKAREILNNYEGGANKLPSNHEVAQQFVKEYKAEHPGRKQYSYASGERQEDINYWMMTVDPNSMKTEAEKQLLQNYKSLRMKIDLNRMRQRDYAEKIAQLEKIKDPDRSTKNKIEGYKIRIENAKAAVKELESQLANITSNEGYARMMFQQNKIMEDFVMGRTQKDVESNISAMQRIAQSISERMAETQKKLEEMSNSAAVRNMRTFVDQKELDKWAAYFRKQYGSNMNKQELMDGLTGIALKLAAGRDITSDVEILAGQILAGVKGEDYTLSMLRGLTIRLGKGQIKELLGENSSLKELRKQLAGTGIKVEAAKDGQAGLDADWDELCDLIPSLNRDVTEKDQVGEILRLVQSARNEAAQNMAEDQLSSIMAEIVANAMRISQGMPRDSETKTRISDMLDYIEEMAKEAGTAGADIRKLRDSISNMIEAGERAAGWTRAMRSDVQQAIDYFDKTAKMAIDSAKQQKTSEIVQQLKDKHAQKILEINEEWRDLIERDRKARDLAEANESTRGIINTDARRLYKLLKEQTPQKNIPEHMQGIVRAMLRELLDNDMSEGRRKILRMNPKERAEMERLLTAWDIQNGKFDINTDIEDSEETPRMILWDDFNMIMEGLEAYSKPGDRKNKLDMLNDRQAALKKIQEAVSEIYGLVRSAQEIAIGDRRIAVEDQAYKVQGETGGKKFREWTGKFGRAIAALHKGIISGNMTPEYFFRGLKNAGLWDLWDGYHEAENRNGLELKRAKEKMASIAADHGYKNWDMNKRLTVQLEKGGSVQMTLGQLMSLYATWKREQAIGPAQSKHLEIGGFYVEEEDPRDGLLGRKATEKKAHRVTANDMALVQSLLTKEQMEYVDDVVNFMSHDLSKLGNEASMKAYGIKLYKEDYYFPFKMWDGIRSRKSNDAGSAAKNDRAFHPSFAKTRLHGANNALILGDFTETATDHIVGMINYATMGLANENLQKVLNATVTEGEEKDTQTKRNIRTILEEAYGREAMQYLAKLQEQLNGGAAQGERSLGDKAITLFRKNAVAGSLSVAFQQPLSYIRAAMMMNPKYLAGAILKEYWKGSYKQLLKHSGIAVLKDMGRFDMGMAKVAKDYIAPEGKEGKIRTAWDKVTDYATILPEKMDAWTWTRMWVAVKAEQHEEHPEMDMDSDEFLDMCGERFNDIMRRTQVYDSTLVKSANMRSTNYWTKSLTSFMAEPTLTANMLMDAVRNVREKGGKLALARAGALYLLSAAAQAAIKAVFSSGRSPDEDKTWVENFLYRFAGNLINETDPFNLIPGYSDAVTLLKGGELNDDAMGAVGKIFQAGKNGVELIKEGFGKEPHRDLEDSVGQLTQLFTDLPLKNLMRDARAMYNWFVKKPYAGRETNADVILHQTIDQAANADNILGVINKWLGEAGYETSNKAYYKRIYEAKKAGNDSQAKSMIDYLLTGKGVNESTLNNGIKGFGKEDTSLSVDEKAKILSGTGKTDDDVWWEMDRAAYKEETGRDVGSGKYYRLTDAINSNKSAEIRKAVDQLVKHGVEKKNIKDKLSDWKQPYLSAKGNEKVKIKNALIMAYKALGISETEANEIINKWK